MSKKGELKLIFARALVKSSHHLRILSAIFETASEKVLKYAQRVSPTLKNKEAKKKTAYHESGHAVLCCQLPGNGELFELNLLGDASSKGFIGHKDNSLNDLTADQMINVIAMIFGGLAAEKIKYGPRNHGPGVLHDLKLATEMATNMVDKYGMSDVGAMSVILSKRISFSLFFLKFVTPFTYDHGINNSENFKQKREGAIFKILEEAQKRAEITLRENWTALEEIVEISLRKQILTGDEVRKIIEESDSQLSLKLET